LFFKEDKRMDIPDYHKAPWLQVAAGRTLDEQIESIKENGGHGILPTLRAMVLRGVGIPQPKEKSENCIVFGCYLSFITPLELRDYLRLLDRLGVSYTFLDKEFCCGMPMLFSTEGEERVKVMRAAREFMEMNRDSAQRKGAKTMVYFCPWCAYLAKTFFHDDATCHIYYPDLIMELLEKETLRVAPTVVGYYEGCHTRNRFYAPGISLDWVRYRKLLDRIEGLTVVDLPRDICCIESAERIVEAAKERKLDTILLSCVSGYVAIRGIAGGRIQTRYFPEILLQALGGE